LTEKYPGFKKIDTNETLGDVYEVEAKEILENVITPFLKKNPEGYNNRLTND